MQTALKIERSGQSPVKTLFKKDLSPQLLSQIVPKRDKALKQAPTVSGVSSIRESQMRNGRTCVLTTSESQTSNLTNDQLTRVFSAQKQRTLSKSGSKEKSSEIKRQPNQQQQYQQAQERTMANVLAKILNQRTKQHHKNTPNNHGKTGQVNQSLQDFRVQVTQLSGDASSQQDLIKGKDRCNISNRKSPLKQIDQRSQRKQSHYAEVQSLLLDSQQECLVPASCSNGYQNRNNSSGTRTQQQFKGQDCIQKQQSPQRYSSYSKRQTSSSSRSQQLCSTQQQLLNHLQASSQQTPSGQKQQSQAIQQLNQELECIVNNLQEGQQLPSEKQFIMLIFETLGQFTCFGELKQLIETLLSILATPITKIVEELEDRREEEKSLVNENKQCQIRMNEMQEELRQLEALVANQKTKIEVLQKEMESKKQLQEQNGKLELIIEQIQQHCFSSPVLEKIINHSEKLKEIVKKQRAKIRESSIKEEKVTRLLYYIRKEGVDVDSIFMKYVQTPSVQSTQRNLGYTHEQIQGEGENSGESSRGSKNQEYYQIDLGEQNHYGNRYDHYHDSNEESQPSRIIIDANQVYSEEEDEEEGQDESGASFNEQNCSSSQERLQPVQPFEFSVASRKNQQQIINYSF